MHSDPNGPDDNASGHGEEDSSGDTVEVPSAFLEGTAADYVRGGGPSDVSFTTPDRTDTWPYRLIRELGQGGFGRVFLAECEDPTFARTRRVAVKLIRISGSKNDLACFHNELDALRSVSHPGIVSLLDSGSIGPQLAYIAMEYVAGETIDRYCENNDCDWRRIVGFLIQACLAIEHAHGRGVLHCDLKPSNMLVDNDGQVVITDFGLVRFLEDIENGLASVSTHLRGTPAYMATEQLVPRESGKVSRASQQTDVFGLGATLYKLLSGQPPRGTRSTLSAIAMAMAREAVPRLDSMSLRCDCPRALIEVVQRAIVDQPELRYASVGPLREDLENVLAGRPIVARPAGVATRLFLWCRREPGSAMVYATTSLAIAGCIALCIAWWRSEIRVASHQQNSVQTALHSVQELQRSVMQIQPGKELSVDARINLLTATRDQYAKLSQRYPRQLALRYRAAQSTFQLAEYLNEVGQWQRAVDEIDNAIVGFEQLLNSSYDSETLKFDLFQSFHKRAYILFSMEQYAVGSESLDLAAAHIKDLYQNHPENLEYADCYAAQLHAIAKLRFDQLDSERLKELLTQTLRVSIALRAHPDSKPRHWKHRMSARMELARLALRDGDPELAMKEFALAVEHAREVHEAVPDAWSHRLDLLQACTEMAFQSAKLGRGNMAIETLQSSEPHLQWLREHRPDLRFLPHLVAQREKAEGLANGAPEVLTVANDNP
jgi:serine/threonine protein kinase/tetratricopeptide (TPR) repeat protein